jgi:hypothetical protein
MSKARFETLDFLGGLPPPGTYRGHIASARLRQSSRGNQMVEVVYTLDEVPPGQEKVADYFVLEGASPRGLAVARFRLVELYRACGLHPHGGDEIRPEDLVGAQVGVRIDHQERDGQVRVRVVGYRELSRPLHEDVPF